MLYPEGPVQSEHANAVLLVEVGKYGERFGRRLRILRIKHSQPIADVPNLLADITIIHVLFLGDGMIVGDRSEAVDTQLFLQLAEIVIHQLQEYTEIRLCETIYGAFAGSNLFCGQCERILICEKQKCQIISPEIPVKSIVGPYLQQFSYLAIGTPHQRILVGLSLICFVYYFA